MAGIRGECSSVIEQSGSLSFCVDFPAGRGIGFIRTEEPKNATGRATIEGYGSEPHNPGLLLVPLRLSIVLPAERVRTLIMELRSWGKLSALSRR